MSKFQLLKRIIKSSFTNINRNKFPGLAAIAVMAVILFIFNIIISINLVANSAINVLNQKVDIIIYLQDNPDQLEINNLLSELKELPEAKEITYTSKEEALAQLLQEYPDQENPFQKYGLENKLPANIRVITHSPKEHPKIISFIQNSRYADMLVEIEDNRENEKITGKVINITGLTKKILFGITLAFLAGGTLIIINAIQLALYNRKEEIQIMKLVGADSHYIYSPFLIEGAFYGVISVFLSSIMFITFISENELANAGFPLSAGTISGLILNETIISILLGSIASLIAVRKHIKSY